MSSIEDLKKELANLKAQRESEAEVKKLKAQIKAEKFGQTKTGKVFNAIGNLGTPVVKYLGKPLPAQASGSSKKKKKTPVRMSVEELMRKLPQ